MHNKSVPIKESVCTKVSMVFAFLHECNVCVFESIKCYACGTIWISFLFFSPLCRATRFTFFVILDIDGYQYFCFALCIITVEPKQHHVPNSNISSKAHTTSPNHENHFLLALQKKSSKIWKKEKNLNKMSCRIRTLHCLIAELFCRISNASEILLRNGKSSSTS